MRVQKAGTRIDPYRPLSLNVQTVNQVLTGRRSVYANDLLPSYRQDLHFFTARVISFLIIAKGSFNERCLIVNGQMSRWSALSINYTRAHAPPRP